MKRLSFLVCVLVASSLLSANSFAGLLLDVDFDSNITVKVTQDSPNPSGAGGTLEFTYVGQPPVVIDGTPTSNPGDRQIQWDWIINDIDTSETGLIKITKIPNFGAGTPGLGLSGYEFTFAFVIDNPEDFTINLSGVWEGEHISQSARVPEPFTFALLAVGGLLIRNRHYSN